MKYFYLIAFVLALATAYAVSQTPPNPSAPPNAQQQSTSPSSPAAAPDQPMPAQGDQDAPRPGQPDQAKNPSGAPAAAASAGESATTDDASLQTQIQQQLAGQNFGSVIVNVKDGVATLTGSVPTKADRKRAKELAKNVAGVKKVSEKLEVNPKAATASPAPQNTAGSIVGNATNGTQAPVTSSTAPSTSTQAQTTGGVSGSASSTSGAAGTVAGSGKPQSAAGTVAGNEQGIGTTSGAAATTESPDATDLQSKIDGAIKNEPTLSSASVLVHVTADTIELSGSVPTGKEKTTAQRIAQSFAGNRKVVDKVTVTGNGVNTGNNPPLNNNPK